MTIRESAPISHPQRASQSTATVPTHSAQLKNSIAEQVKRSASTIPSVPSPQMLQQGGSSANPPHPALSNPLLPLAALPYYGQGLPSPFLTPNQLSSAAAAHFNTNSVSYFTFVITEHLKEYPTLHYFGIPRHTRAMIAYKFFLAKRSWISM